MKWLKRKGAIIDPNISRLMDRMGNLEKEIFELKNKPKWKQGDKVSVGMGICGWYDGEIINHRVNVYFNTFGTVKIGYKYNILFNGEIREAYEYEITKRVVKKKK